LKEQAKNWRDLYNFIRQCTMSLLWVTAVVDEVEEVVVISHLTPRCGRWW
jgi:hypothetical protein